MATGNHKTPASARIRDHIRANVAGYLALAIVLTTGTAYAVDGPLPGQNTVGSEDIIGNEVKSDDIGNGRVFDLDIADNVIAPNKVKPESVTGADVSESTMNGSAIQQRGGVIDTPVTFCGFGICPVYELLPGLGYRIGCGGSGMFVLFATTAPGTANAMMVAQGIDDPPSPVDPVDFLPVNGAKAQGTVLHPADPPEYDADGGLYGHYVVYRVEDYDGGDGGNDAQVESQFVIDAGAKTYSIMLHTLHSPYDGENGGNCDVNATARMAG